MEVMPNDDQLRLAAYVGARFGRDNRRPAVAYDRADDVQDARLALLNAWPALVAHYPDGVPNGAIYTTVNNRLIDLLRTRSGWKRKMRHPYVLSIDKLVGEDDDKQWEVQIGRAHV